jgi:hypothetical protein
MGSRTRQLRRATLGNLNGLLPRGTNTSVTTDAPNLPAWAQGHTTEISTEDGAAVLNSGAVLDSCMVMMGTPEGSTSSWLFARTTDDVYSWKAD